MTDAVSRPVAASADALARPVRTPGDRNVQVWGFDVNAPVFGLSAGALLPFIGLTLLFPDTMSAALNTAKTWTLSQFDWAFVVVTNIVALVCIAIAVSPLGRIRLGGDDAQPEFGRLSWLAMLFSAGMGTGMMFWGAAEPVAFYTNWFGTPFNTPPFTAEAEALAYSATLFHWGLTPWAVYAIVGMALAFFAFNRGLPLAVRSAFYPVLGDKIWGWPGHIIDWIAVIATVFGLASTLGMGATLTASGLGYLFGTPDTLAIKVAIIVIVTLVAIGSVVRGLDGGVRRLSNLNLILAAGLFAFVLVCGPTAKILSNWATASLDYAADTVRLSNWVGREDTDWFHGWTILYWAWWISWSPFVGLFIARISKGRTVREFALGVLGAPVLAAIVWFSTFGTLAIEQIKSGVGELAVDGMTRESLVLFQTLAPLPFAQIASIVAIILLLVFFVTSSDSGSLVVDSLTAGGKLDPPIRQRVFWASVEGLVAIALLVGGGATALSSLQSGVITAGLPFTFLLLACCFSLTLGLIEEHRRHTPQAKSR